MLLKKRRKKLVKILAVGLLVLGMIGMAIPQGILAINNTITYESLNIGDIVLPGNEITEWGGGGSKSYVAYNMGSGKFKKTAYVYTNSGQEIQEIDISNYLLDGNDVGYALPNNIDGYQNATEHTILSYDEVAAKATEGHPVDALPSGTVFAGWVFGKDGTYDVKSVGGINLVPILVSYRDNQYTPAVQYVKEEGTTKIYVTPSEVDGSLFYGQSKQEITKDMIVDPQWGQAVNMTLDNQFNVYTQDDITNIHNAIQPKTALKAIEDTKKGESITLTYEEVKADGYDNVRYIPKSWKVDTLHLNGDFNETGAQARAITSTYQTEIPTNEIGDYSVDVIWQGQVLQDGQWVDIQNENNHAQMLSTAEYTVYEEQQVVPDVQPDDNKPNTDKDPVQPEEPVQPSQPEEPVQPSQPIVNPNDSIKPEDNQQNPIENPSIPEQNNKIPEKTNNNAPVTQDETSLGLISALCAGSLLTIGVLIVVKRKLS